MAIDLVTGGGGYLGSYLVRALLARGRTVRVLDMVPAPDSLDRVDWVRGDIRDRDLVRRALDGASRVFHTAFVQSLSRRPESERESINVGGTRLLVEESAAAGLERFVFASTIEIYGTRPPDPCPEDAPCDRPVGWYGRHKALCEESIWRSSSEHQLPAAALRMPTICGRGFYNHRPLLSLMDRILSGRRVAVVGDGSVLADFVTVDDVVNGFCLAAERPEAIGEAFNISARESSTHLEILVAMIEAVGSRSRVIGVPRWAARALVPVGRLLRLHDLPRSQDGYLFHTNRYSIEKARRLLGYAPAHSSAEAAAALIAGYVCDRAKVRVRARDY